MVHDVKRLGGGLRAGGVGEKGGVGDGGFEGRLLPFFFQNDGLGFFVGPLELKRIEVTKPRRRIAFLGLGIALPLFGFETLLRFGLRAFAFLRVGGFGPPIDSGRLEPTRCAVFDLPQVFGIVAEVGADLPVLYPPHLVDDLVEEVAIMADDDKRARILFEGFDEHIDRLDVEVVGGLIEDEKVGGGEEGAGQGHAALLATGEYGDGLEDIVAPEEEGAEERADLGVGLTLCLLAERVEDGVPWVERLGLMLCEKCEVGVMAEGAGAAEGLGAVEDAGEGGFAGAVAPDECDLIAALDGERPRAVEHGDVALGRRVDLGERRDLHHHFARAARLRKANRDGGFIRGGRGEPVHLFQHLDAALRLPGFGGFVPKSLDKPLHLGNMLLLVVVSILLKHDALGSLFQIKRIVARILGDAPPCEIGDGVHHAVEEVSVVRDDDDGAGVILEVAFEPVDAVDVEVVGGLVEEEDVGAAEEEAGEGHAHTPSARKRGEGAVEVIGGEAEPGEDGFAAGLHEVGFPAGELRVDAVKGVKQLLVAGGRVVRLALAVIGDAVLFFLQCKYILEGLHGLVEDRPLGGHFLRILFEVSDGDAARDERAFVRRMLP